MNPFGRLFQTARAAAILAVVLFSQASVTSVVMQAAASTPSMAGMDMSGMGGMSMGGMSMDMPGMDMGHGAPSDGPDGKAKSELCAFCSAAAHAPILSTAPPVLSPSVVVWRVAPASQTEGERGPPSFRATARGPPSPLQSA